MLCVTLRPLQRYMVIETEDEAELINILCNLWPVAQTRGLV
jgi:hypothetical protein